ncbi:hypothetical protein PHYSODRAFT_286019 [Phytophthora sojae]|uniref:Uncharacterized protein n=1 Tax=Phytophthora sojae (strain P6497) TaxID=1094619 RepID=G4ZGX5_PHYSP|nr:hypothetical protein PHYSODRAFT_286019 [Phytophthora sojae]EGZ18041.1 hypothetical protein PHYSODRAFT_286019 [Phytophthora sojae]|eukprot:XP_009527099.1 hypothetical protein PHYSODRAFT_286019 [Phytophthora sojae]
MISILSTTRNSIRFGKRDHDSRRDEPISQFDKCPNSPHLELVFGLVLLAHASAQSPASDSEQAQVSQVESPLQSLGSRHLRALKSHQEAADDDVAEERIDFSALIKKFLKHVPGTAPHNKAAAEKKATLDAKKLKAALRKEMDQELFNKLAYGKLDDQLHKPQPDSVPSAGRHVAMASSYKQYMDLLAAAQASKIKKRTKLVESV